MTRFRIYPYKQGSASAKLLSQALGGKVLKLVGSKYKPRLGDYIINWGNSNLPEFDFYNVLNLNTRLASDKLISFRVFKDFDVSVPGFWTSKADIPLEAFPVVCRTVLNGHSGRGIVIAKTPEELVEAPLYTKYIKKKDEYRVHCFKGRAIFVQRKARRLDVAEPNWHIRNVAGGFVFALQEIEEVPEQVIDQAILAVGALGLDFGGADVIWNEYQGKAYVLEVNTAMGLEQRSADFYAQAFENLEL